MTDFEQIYRAYFQDVYAYLLRLSGDAQLAEEMTSDAFFKAMGAIDRFRGDCDVRVWLCQIAKNCYYSHCKKTGRAVLMGVESLWALPAQDKTAEERLIQRETAARARQILHTLPEPYKEVFLWRVFGELSFRQIGQLFGKSENWACVTYHRAKTRIQNRMEEKHHDV